jgi:hypothetical protein
MIKITDEQAAKLGIASFEDLEARLAGATASNTRAVAAEAGLVKLTARIEALEASVSALPKIDTAAIVNDALTKANASAETIAAKQVSAAIARAGQNGLAPNKPQTEGTEPANTHAPDDYKSQWDADANLRGEFLGNFSTYKAFMKAENQGRINNRITKADAK